MSGLSPRAADVANRLATQTRVRIPLELLWVIFEQVDPSSRLNPERRRMLFEALVELRDAGLVRWSSHAAMDQTERPALPRSVTRAERAPELVTTNRPPVWHPELSWVERAGLNAEQRRVLTQINVWLHRDRQLGVAPTRERSLEIFGDEKLLDTLSTGSLFQEGRLSLALLRTRRTVLPIVREAVGPGPDLLIVENADTFDSLVRTLRARQDHAIGQIGWGAGNAFKASVLSIAQMAAMPRRVYYFGDLDEAGLDIPARAHELSSRLGGPSIVPAQALYEALLAQPRRQRGLMALCPARAGELVRWLHSSQHERASQVLVAGQRIAQENLGLSYLSSNDGWVP